MWEVYTVLFLLNPIYLELLIGSFEAIFSHDCLDRFCQHLPCVVQVILDCILVHLYGESKQLWKCKFYAPAWREKIFLGLLLFLSSSLRMPVSQELYAIRQYPSPTPKFRKTVESVRSRCHLETGSLAARCSRMVLPRPMFPSEFSKSIGFTLWGIVLEPTSPLIVFCLKYPKDMYPHMSRLKSRRMVLKRLMAWKSSAM